MTAKKAKLIAATARLDKTPKPTKAQKIRQQRQVQAWRKAQEAKR